jgi:hypothetical protein
VIAVKPVRCQTNIGHNNSIDSIKDDQQFEEVKLGGTLGDETALINVLGNDCTKVAQSQM